MSASLKRLAIVRQSSFPTCRFCIEGTAVRRCRRSLLSFASIQVVFQLKIAMGDRKDWEIQCTLRDFTELHRDLQKRVDDPIFQTSLETLVVPKQPLFHRRNTMVIKGMCVDLEYYLCNLLKLCQGYVQSPTSPKEAAAAVEAIMRAFLEAKATMALGRGYPLTIAQRPGASKGVTKVA
ncbi:Aste57867_7963 [Aphanomyces stellatus]|uniref:Aste57867_7963 protein n=1 Tax=Aphanomyces stellatus TaxID=120398 RepID=A0A485KJ38_9STRA|nr:hypothetical protein As57867_007933 [Aphanomyces stellatus]VFT84856.1 Aste57867_7963 [Aphanomyces stellatus]